MMPSNLQNLCQDILLDLRIAPKKRKSPWRTPVVSTIGADGYPWARVVVLRRATESYLELHTDTRSRKWGQLMESPQMTWTFWDRNRQMQLRVRGKVTQHHKDDASDTMWGCTSAGAKKTYGVAPAPSSPISTPMGYDLNEDGYEYFGVVRCYFDWMDWLHLARGGHQRAIFQRTNGEWSGTYVAP